MTSPDSGKRTAGSFSKILLLLVLALIVVAAIIMQILLRPNRSALLKIVYTGGIQGHYQYEENVSAGYGKIVSVKDQYRDEGCEVILIDSGSSLGGSSSAELSSGESMLELMNTAGYNAMTPGSLDFVYGIDRLKELRTQAEFPFLVCNLKNVDGSKAFEDYKVMNINGVRIGITGVTDGLSEASLSREGLIYEDPVDSVKEAVKAMGGRVDAFIVIASLSDTEVIEQIAQIKDVDLVITSSREEVLEQTADGALIVSPAAYSSTIGVVSMDVRRNEISFENEQIGESVFSELPDASEISKKAAAVEEDLKLRANVSFVLSDQYIDNKKDSEDDTEEYYDDEEDEEENPLRTSAAGALTADAMLDEGAAWSADAALIRSSEIKGSISGSKMKVSDVLALYDDDSYLVVCRMTGGELRSIVEKCVEEGIIEPEKMLQAAGIRCEINEDREMGSRVSEIIIGSSKLDDAGTYYVAMTDSMAKEFGFGLHSSGFVAAGRSIAGIVSDYISGKISLVYKWEMV